MDHLRRHLIYIGILVYVNNPRIYLENDTGTDAFELGPRAGSEVARIIGAHTQVYAWVQET